MKQSTKPQSSQPEHLDRAENRLDRTDPSLVNRDFRVRAFQEAIALLADPSASDGPDTRVERIQLLLSDPTTEPRPALDTKSARGAYDRWTLGVA
jgi:hypothetical protein